MINNLNVIGNLVDYYHSMFLAENIGYKSLPQSDKDLLKSKGYKDTTKKNDDLLTLAYQFGKASTAGDPKILDKINYLEFAKFSREHMPLTREDDFVIQHIKASFYNDVKRANNRVKDNINSEIVKINKDRRYYIRTKLKGKFKAKDFKPDPAVLNHLQNYLGQSEKEWLNHFDLITSYNFHAAYCQGIATSLLQKHGNDVMVYYTVHSEACVNCKKTYLLPNGKPRIFKLLDVIKNGDNIGRKKNELKASLSPLHPRCRCVLHHYKPKKKVVKIL